MTHIKIPFEKISINEDKKEAAITESEEILNFIKDKQDGSLPSDIGELDLKNIHLDATGRIVFTNISPDALLKIKQLKQNPDITGINIGACTTRNMLCV